MKSVYFIQITASWASLLVAKLLFGAAGVEHMFLGQVLVRVKHFQGRCSSSAATNRLSGSTRLNCLSASAA